MNNIKNTHHKAHWDKKLYPEFRINSRGEQIRTYFDVEALRPTNDLFTRYFHEPKLRRFFHDLAQHDIHNLEDIKDRTPEELFELAPMNKNGQKLFLAYVAEGLIIVKDAKPS
jgi:hypothetical protein